MTTIEAALTRKFAITFIDARTIATEAKLKLDIHTYPTQEEKELLIAEASNIFESYAGVLQDSMQANQLCLEDIKMKNGSISSLEDSSVQSTTSSCVSSTSTTPTSDESSRSSSKLTRFFLKR